MIAVIPMAGFGSRFADAGYNVPKPLLPLLSKPLFYWAAHSLPLAQVTRIVFVTLRSHVDEYEIIDAAREHITDAPFDFVVVDEVPNGQLMSVLTAREHLATDDSVLIYNADTYTQGPYRKIVNLAERPLAQRNLSGVLVVFSAEGDHWSFARETPDGSVDLVTEKVRVSPLCSNGMYWFRSGNEFLACAESHVAKGGTGEFYVAPIYNDLIQAGERVEVERVERVLSFGTPAEYKASEAVLSNWLGLTQ